MGGLIDVIESKIIPAVGKIAPLLGSVLGTPLAGIALSLISSAFGIDPKKLDDLDHAITNDPDAANKLRTIENDHSEMLAKIASTDYSTEVSDRIDARKYGEQYKDFMRHMAFLVTFGFFMALFGLFLPLTITGDEKNLLSMLVGMLAAKWSTIIDFFFGSSRQNGQGALK
jgi:hypothetical protein